MKEQERVFLLDLTVHEASTLSMALFNYIRQDNCPEPDGVQQELLNIVRRLDDFIAFGKD